MEYAADEEKFFKVRTPPMVAAHIWGAGFQGRPHAPALALAQSAGKRWS